MKESVKDYDSEYRRWLDEIELSEKDRKRWWERGQKVVDRYLDQASEYQDDHHDKKYNVLWSNVQTMLPILFARQPKAEVERRYRDRDPVGRLASMMIERSLDYCIEEYKLVDTVKSNVEDLLLPGLACAWVRYEPKFESVRVPVLEVEGTYYSATGEVVTDIETDEQGPHIMQERIAYEQAPVDYVHWRDFLHGPGRVWAEVTWVARIVYMTKDEATERFGEEAEQITYDVSPELKEEHESSNVFKKGKVYELWDKSSKTVFWLAKGMRELLDKREDPMKLKDFYPCPKPLLATTANGSLIPVPDYCMYQDQAQEMDELTQRISLLTKALRVVGVYSSTEKDTLSGMLSGDDNQMIPIDQWAAFAEKGGLKGVVDWLPVDMVIQVVDRLYLAREACKQTIFEITGIADIVRGQTDPNETLGAQKIKGQFATLRLQERQKDVARYVRDIIRIKAEIICTLFQPQTIILMSGVEHTEQDQQIIPQALELLKDDAMRNFRIDIETESTIAIDEDAEKALRMEFLGAAGSFLEKALPVVQNSPAAGPLLGKMLLFGVRGFKIGRELESAFEEAIEAMGQQQQQQGPDPAQMELQQEAQKDEAELALEAKRDEGELALRAKKDAGELELKARKQWLGG